MHAKLLGGFQINEVNNKTYSQNIFMLWKKVITF